MVYNPDTNEYRIVTGYDENSNGVNGILIHPSRVQEVLNNIKSGHWNVDNAYIVNLSNSNLKPDSPITYPDPAYKRQGGKIN